MDNLTLYQCPKFQHCNAPICPLDTEWHKRRHFCGERVCFYLIEAKKQGAKANFERSGLGYLFEPIVSLTPVITDKFTAIKKALEKAALTSSRMTNKFGRDHEQ